ncbi:hypothetical protein [Euzebya tangerina]|uniref:hypothetical protein n=1 Tax=Euzebya tangerina TaxID=591198 RepID=UPI000E31CC05|nr:hypothetical protein [Euzebya tangerina]
MTWVFRQPFDPITEAGEIAVMAGVGAALVATGIMLAPILWLVQRSTPTPGGHLARCCGCCTAEHGAESAASTPPAATG